jgi:hypothetical protein
MMCMKCKGSKGKKPLFPAMPKEKPEPVLTC